VDKIKNIEQYYAEHNCMPQETEIKNVRLAAAYVPFETLCVLFKPMKSLMMGTAFPELYSPYEGKEKRYNSFEMSGRSDLYD
jgi:hypothetical protein